MPSLQSAVIESTIAERAVTVDEHVIMPNGFVGARDENSLSHVVEAMSRSPISPVASEAAKSKSLAEGTCFSAVRTKLLGGI